MHTSCNRIACCEIGDGGKFQIILICMDFRLEDAEFNVEAQITQAKYLRMLRWCEICKTEDDLIVCERCKSVFYCSQVHKM